MRKELFTEFNTRYDELNNTLLNIDRDIRYKQPKLNDFSQIRVLNDYINLCAEEYYWYKKGRLYEDIWKAWQCGIHYWYENLLSLRELWETEKNGGGNTAFYLNENEDFFVKDMSKM